MGAVSKLLSHIVNPFHEIPRTLAAMHLAGNSGYLTKSGWLRSAVSRQAVDADGLPLPWYTYAAIKFIGSRLRPEMSVFEYGTGHSTLWYARRVASCLGCEHDPDWLRLVTEKLPSNATVIHRSANPVETYVSSLHDSGRQFDVVVVDGLARNACLNAVDSGLTASGVVILDNSDIPEYDDGTAGMINRGFRRIDFAGLGPINAYGWTTSVLYRPQNCFGI